MVLKVKDKPSINHWHLSFVKTSYLLSLPLCIHLFLVSQSILTADLKPNEIAVYFVIQDVLCRTRVLLVTIIPRHTSYWNILVDEYLMTIVQISRGPFLTVVVTKIENKLEVRLMLTDSLHQKWDGATSVSKNNLTVLN